MGVKSMTHVAVSTFLLFKVGNLGAREGVIVIWFNVLCGCIWMYKEYLTLGWLGSLTVCNARLLLF